MPMTAIFGKEFNIRVVVDSEGRASIGMIQGFFEVDSNCIDITPVSEDSREALAKLLNTRLRVVNKPWKELRTGLADARDLLDGTEEKELCKNVD